MKHILTVAIALLCVVMPAESQAYDQKGCAIWLCLPMGFPSGCGEARSEFISRVRRFKPPLPSFPSCLASSPIPMGKEQAMSSIDGVAAFIPEYRVCKEYKWTGSNSEDRGRVCTDWEVYPDHVVMNRRCYRYKHKDDSAWSSNPPRCIKTIRWIKTFMDGQEYGETYFFDNRGTRINIDKQQVK